MKYWIPGILALMISVSTYAQDYRVVSSPVLKLDVYIDNVKNNKTESWCATTIPLRIVSGETRDAKVLSNFLPRVGTLLETQCGKLKSLPWKLTDKHNELLAHGTSIKQTQWAAEIVPSSQPAATGIAPELTPAPTSPIADATPWQRFNLPDGCAFRLYWDEEGAVPALFIPTGSGLTCSPEGWINGENHITRLANGQLSTTELTFIQGFPITHLQPGDTTLNIIAANNQRLVLANQQAPDSWLILPYDSTQHTWTFDGTIAVQLSKSQAHDVNQLTPYLQRLHQIWGPFIGQDEKVRFLLVEKMQPELQDPATGVYQTIN